jgi:hypothetical protein
VINGREAAAGEVLVRFARQPAETERLAIERDADAAESEPVGPAFRRMRSRTLDVAALIASVRRRAIVEYAEPNYLYHITNSPNDPGFSGRQWNFSALDMPRAWDINPGARASIIVAVVDTGITRTWSRSSLRRDGHRISIWRRTCGARRRPSA